MAFPTATAQTNPPQDIQRLRPAYVAAHNAPRLALLESQPYAPNQSQGAASSLYRRHPWMLHVSAQPRARPTTPSNTSSTRSRRFATSPSVTRNSTGSFCVSSWLLSPATDHRMSAAGCRSPTPSTGACWSICAGEVSQGSWWQSLPRSARRIPRTREGTGAGAIASQNYGNEIEVVSRCCPSSSGSVRPGVLALLLGALVLTACGKPSASVLSSDGRFDHYPDCHCGAPRELRDLRLVAGREGARRRLPVLHPGRRVWPPCPVEGNQAHNRGRPYSGQLRGRRERQGREDHRLTKRRFRNENGDLGDV
jgi:hypothetical protein